MENRGRMGTTTEKSNRLSSLNELQRAVTSEMRGCSHSALASCQSTHTCIYPLSHAVRHASRLLLPPSLSLCPFFEWGLSLFLAAESHFLPLHEEPVELFSLTLSSHSVSLCLRLAAVTPSSLRWPIIIGSSG